MKWSKYNHLFKSPKFGYLLYNSETNSFAKLDEELFSALKDISQDNNKIKDIDTDILESLLQGKILIKKEIQNDFLYEKRFNYNLNTFNPEHLGLAIAPTTHCNFNCPYCYEEDRRPDYIDEETIDNLVEYIKKHEHVKSLSITWYGGEPLLAFKKIKQILERIAKLDITLNRHDVVTNGYLLDKEKAIYFQENNVTNMQITIDGDKKYHDNRRVLTSGAPTYDKIIENIDTFFKYNTSTHISIRMNLDDSNKDSFYPIYKELLERWKGKRIGIYPAFIKDYTENCSTHCSVVDREKRVNFYTDLYKKHNAEINFFPEHHIGGCGATNANYYVIGPKGEMYKCWNDIGIKERIIGYVNSDEVVNYNILTRYISGPTMFDDQECLDCKLFPVCDGGCNWLRQKNVFEGAKHDLCTNRKGNLNQFLELHYEQQLQRREQEAQTES